MNRSILSVPIAPLRFAWVALVLCGICHAQDRSGGGASPLTIKEETAKAQQTEKQVEEQKAKLRASLGQVRNVQEVELGAGADAGNAVVIYAGDGLRVMSETAHTRGAVVEGGQSEKGDEEKQKFIEGLTEARRLAYEVEMKETIATLVETLQLDEETAEKLAEGIGDAVDVSMNAWSGQVEKTFENLVIRMGGNRTNVLRTSPNQMLRLAVVIGVSSPENQTNWYDHLRKSLPDERFLAWQEWTAKQQKEREQQIADWIESVLDVRRQQMQQRMEPITSELIEILSLKPHRAEQLKKTAARAVDEVIETMASIENETIRQQDKKMQEQMLLRRGVSGTGGVPSVDESSNWKDALAAFLTVEEEQLLVAKQQQQKQRQTDAVKQAIFLTLDKRLLLTSEQLNVLANSIDEPAATFAQSMKGFFNMDDLMVGKCLSTAKLEAFRETLDSSQIALLDAIIDDRNGQMRNPFATEIKYAPSVDSNEELQEKIGSIIRLRYDHNLTRLQVELECQLAEVDRVSGLSKEEKDTLRLAAVGVAQDSLQPQRQQIALSAYHAVFSASPEQLPQRLASLNNLGTSRLGNPTHSPFWIHAVRTIIDTERLSLLDAERETRNTRVRAAQKQLVLFETDRVASLSDKQYADLSERLEVILDEHGPEIDAYMSQQPRDWAVISHTMFVPLAAIPKDELAQIFGPRQRLLLERQLAGVQPYWQQMKRKKNLRTR